MQVISLERSSLAQTALVSLVTLASLVLLGVVLAYWTWTWLAPRPQPRAQAAAEPRGGEGSARGMFGSLQRGSLPRDDGSIAAPAGIALKLLGVVAATRGRHGYAVVQLEAREFLAVREGEDVAPGIRLAEVHPDHVVLLRDGVRETLAWPQKNTAARSATARIDK